MADDYPFGGEPTRNDKIPVGTTSVLISPAHERQEFIVVNSSPGVEVITISVGKEAVALAGIPMQPWSSWDGFRSPNFNPTHEPIYAICSAATGQISIFER